MPYEQQQKIKSVLLLTEMKNQPEVTGKNVAEVRTQVITNIIETQ